MSKLVAFYSRADENYFKGTYKYIEVGNTERAANMIAEITGADLFKIEQKKPYAKDYNTCIAQAKSDLNSGARPELVSKLSSIDKYDEIYLCYPNYWGNLPMAVYTFIESLDWNGKTIHPLCTHEGSGLSQTEKRIAEAAAGSDVTKGLAIFGSSVDTSKAAIEKWIDGFKSK